MTFGCYITLCLKRALNWTESPHAAISSERLRSTSALTMRRKLQGCALMRCELQLLILLVGRAMKAFDGGTRIQ